MSHSYKKLEEFADKMRVERNSYLAEKLSLEERIRDLETKLYYCRSNKKLTTKTSPLHNKDYERKLIYTAITRAKSKLELAITLDK